MDTLPTAAKRRVQRRIYCDNGSEFTVRLVDLWAYGNQVTNAVLPGAVDTPMLEAGLRRSSGKPGQAREGLIYSTPLKRLADPEDIAKAIVFPLHGAQSLLINGQTLTIDRGVLARLDSE